MRRKAERPTSIKDIARALGISHSTVSRALRDSPLVQADTASDVKRKAEELGYQASAVARGLVTQQTRTIGVVVTTVADPFHGDIVSGIEEIASAEGYSVILANAHIDPVREIEVVRSLRGRRVDGILVASSRVGERYISLMSEMHVPIVLINNQHHDAFVYSVSIDDFESARKATAYLTGLGHRDIAYIGDRLGFQSEVSRFEGYRKALQEAGIRYRSELAIQGDGLPGGCSDGVRHLLAQPRRPTALFCYNDMTALGALNTIPELHLSVPYDVSVVGFDDLFFASYLQPPLTTVRQPRLDMGRQAMAWMLSLLAGIQTENNSIVVEGELVIRGSTAEPNRACYSAAN